MRMLILVFALVAEFALRALVWGFISYKIMESKGYSKEEAKLYILWGALFGVLAVIAAAVKSPFQSTYQYDGEFMSKLTGDPAYDPKQQPVKAGYWRCPNCSTDNPDYTGSCGCGYSKYNN